MLAGREMGLGIMTSLANIDVIKGEKGRPSTIRVTGLADIFTTRLMRPPSEPTTAASASDALVQSVYTQAQQGRVQRDKRRKG